jgi:hypothetical protein
MITQISKKSIRHKVSWYNGYSLIVILIRVIFDLDSMVLVLYGRQELAKIEYTLKQIEKMKL